MTQQLRNGTLKTTQFSQWLRMCDDLDSRQYGLSIVDIDWCIHQYRVHTDSGGTREIQNMMFIEEKTHGADCSSSQRDTLRAVAQVFRGCVRGQPQRIKIKSEVTGGMVMLRNWGYHLLRFSAAGPLDSQWIEWDRKPIDIDLLIKILRFEVSPITLMPRTERRHHGGAKQAKFDF